MAAPTKPIGLRIEYFVHATTVHNEQGIMTGWSDSPLSDRGVHQAHELAQFVKGTSRFDRVLSSDLGRAQATASVAFGNFTTDVRLREINYGIYNGMPRDDAAQVSEQFVTVPYPEGESFRDVEFRVRSLIRELSAYPHPRVAFISHRAPQLALEVIANGCSWTTAIAADWRKVGAFKPGWFYSVTLPDK